MKYMDGFKCVAPPGMPGKVGGHCYILHEDKVIGLPFNWARGEWNQIKTVKWR